MIKDFLRRAVVVGQNDAGVIGVPLAETMDVADIGALETVNRLIIVAYRHNVWRIAVRRVCQVEENTQLR